MSRALVTVVGTGVVVALAVIGCGSNDSGSGGGGQAASGGSPASGGGPGSGGSNASGGSSAGGSNETGGASASGGGGATPGGFPDATNTGSKNAPGCNGKLTPWGDKTVASGKTYSCIDFAGGVSVGSRDAPVTGVKFVGCRFHGANPGGALVTLYGNDISFDYSSFEPDVAGPTNVAYDDSYQYGLAGNGGYYTEVGKLTVTHSDFWGFGNAIDVNPTPDADKPQVYRDNWIHHAADIQHDVYHHDGIGAESGSSKGSYVTIDHNTIESLGNTNGVAYQATGPYTHFTVTNNLFGGFGYTVAILGGSSDVTFTGNTYSTRIDTTYGPLYPADFWTKAGSTWKDNKWSVPAGAAWGNAAHDGWYWIPGGEGSEADDAGFVSQTDYSN